MTQHTRASNKHDALYIFEAVYSNPNGDPDNGGRPRVDFDTAFGLVSDVSLKRKVRDSVLQRVERGLLPTDRYGIFIRRGISLNEQLDAVAGELGQKSTRKERSADDVRNSQQAMQERFFDVRIFGAVMSTGNSSAGKLTGPVTLGIARSADPVLPVDMGITRTASTTEENKDNASQMGNKSVIPYGLYVARVHYQPTVVPMVSDDDLELFWQCLLTMFEVTRSAARPDINVRGLHVFTHDNPLGNAPARSLLDRITISKRDGVTTPMSFTDYDVGTSATAELPSGVSYANLA